MCGIREQVKTIPAWCGSIYRKHKTIRKTENGCKSRPILQFFEKWTEFYIDGDSSKDAKKKRSNHLVKCFQRDLPKDLSEIVKLLNGL